MIEIDAIAFQERAAGYAAYHRIETAMARQESIDDRARAFVGIMRLASRMEWRDLTPTTAADYAYWRPMPYLKLDGD